MSALDLPHDCRAPAHPPRAPPIHMLPHPTPSVVEKLRTPDDNEEEEI